MRRRRAVAGALTALVIGGSTYAGIALAQVPSEGQAGEGPPASCGGHSHYHSGDEHKALTRRSFRSYRVPRGARTKHVHMIRCAATPELGEEMGQQWRAAERDHRKRFVWRYRFAAEPASWQGWARSTSACESDYPSQHGNGGMFHGGFQFMLGTWASAPMSPGGDPHTYPWIVQAVVSINLAQRDGTGHWPRCG